MKQRKENLNPRVLTSSLISMLCSIRSLFEWPGLGNEEKLFCFACLLTVHREKINKKLQIILKDTMLKESKRPLNLL